MPTSTDDPPISIRVVAAVVALTLLLVAVLHGIWTSSTWPFASPEDYARLVVGVPEDELPSAGLTAAVALLVTLAGALVAMEGRLLRRVGPRWVRRLGVWTVAGVLAVRGLGGLVADVVAPAYARADFVHLDLLVYSPLCGALAAGTAWVAMRTRHGAAA